MLAGEKGQNGFRLNFFFFQFANTYIFVYICIIKPKGLYTLTVYMHIGGGGKWRR